jgi:uncharacterized protein YdeI (YjbR/CyaY-like superfamily)
MSQRFSATIFKVGINPCVDAPRSLPIPREFKQALEANPKAKQVWTGLSPSRRKEILSYLNHLKQPESLERTITRSIHRFVSGESNSSAWRKAR